MLMSALAKQRGGPGTERWPAGTPGGMGGEFIHTPEAEVAPSTASLRARAKAHAWRPGEAMRILGAAPSIIGDGGQAQPGATA